MKSVLFILAFTVLVLAKTQWQELNGYTFEHYVEEFKKHYTPAEKEFRQRIFQENMEKINAHNQDLSKSWKLGVNQFTDRTPEEMGSMRGLFVQSKDKVTLAKATYDPELIKALSAENVDWRTKGIITPTKNQMACGSCWAFAAAETIESYAALKTGKLEALSEQQILDCTPNPQECGGKGGCYGGTVELAYAQLQTMAGISTEKNYPYQSGTGKAYPCRFNASDSYTTKVRGYVTLPQNEHDPLLHWIATKGPLAVSVDASTWSHYESGVYDGCNMKNPDINHAVQLVGFGTDPKAGDYWLVRNSWSTNWGENGYIRIKRYPVDSIPCGIDNTPEDGNGCKGGPPSVEVCGNCGILFDTVYPLLG